MNTTTPQRTLRPPKNPIEKRSIWWWTLRAIIYNGPILIGLIVTYGLWEAARPWLMIGLVAVGLYFLVNAVVAPQWRYRVHRWESTDIAVYSRTGWYVREWRVAPLSRVQTVDAVRGPLEQLMGLSTLRVTTASSYGAIIINGLDKDTANELAEQLNAIAQDIPGDAT